MSALVLVLTSCGECKEYASKYTCDYVIKEATYDVYYWSNLRAANGENNEFIGSSVGLEACKNLAMNHASSIGEVWDDRAYVCGLVKEGYLMEKHRLLQLDYN